MNIKSTKNSPKGKHTEMVVFNEHPKLIAQVKSYCKTNAIDYNLIEGFEGKSNQKRFAVNEAGNFVLFLGIGSADNHTAVRKAFRKTAVNKKKRMGKALVLDLRNYKSTKTNLSLDTLAEAATNGLLLSTYDIGLYKTGKKDLHPLAQKGAKITVVSEAAGKKTFETKIKEGVAKAETHMSIFDLVNAPGNKARPEEMANWAKASGKKYGYKVTVFNKAKLKQLGMDSLLAVNKGSEYPPAFIIMEYKSKSKTKLKTVGLVGKGVTFDTGGLSIKGSDRMHYMKSDMAGAAAVMGAVEVAAKMKLDAHVVAIIPTTDNCVDATAVKPGDVINSYSGKTIEIIDTDAEGRLILADGLAYMTKNYKPDVLLDLATLTGSAVRALGYQAAAMFTSNDKLAKDLENTAQQTGEAVWRMPLWDVYKKDIESDVADVKNFSGRPVAGAISAAKFLEVFTDAHPAWAHLDIAGAAFGDTGFSKQKSATGYGVNLLFEFIKKQ